MCVNWLGVPRYFKAICCRCKTQCIRLSRKQWNADCPGIDNYTCAAKLLSFQTQRGATGRQFGLCAADIWGDVLDKGHDFHFQRHTRPKHAGLSYSSTSLSCQKPIHIKRVVSTDSIFQRPPPSPVQVIIMSCLTSQLCEDMVKWLLLNLKIKEQAQSMPLFAETFAQNDATSRRVQSNESIFANSIKSTIFCEDQEEEEDSQSLKPSPR